MVVQTYSQSGAADAANYARPISQTPSVNQSALFAAIPQGTRTGQFSVIEPEILGKATNSTQARPFIHIGQQEFEYPINRGDSVPSTPAPFSTNGD